jgi:hypothetical protein
MNQSFRIFFISYMLFYYIFLHRYSIFSCSHMPRNSFQSINENILKAVRSNSKTLIFSSLSYDIGWNIISSLYFLIQCLMEPKNKIEFILKINYKWGKSIVFRFFNVMGDRTGSLQISHTDSTYHSIRYKKCIRKIIHFVANFILKFYDGNFYIIPRIRVIL